MNIFKTKELFSLSICSEIRPPISGSCIDIEVCFNALKEKVYQKIEKIYELKYEKNIVFKLIVEEVEYA